MKSSNVHVEFEHVYIYMFFLKSLSVYPKHLINSKTQACVNNYCTMDKTISVETFE